MSFNLDSWSKVGEIVGGLGGVAIASIAAILLYKTLKTENIAIKTQMQANDFSICWQLYNQIKREIESLNYQCFLSGPLLEKSQEFGLDSLQLWYVNLLQNLDELDFSNTYEFSIILIVKDFDECTKKIENSTLAEFDKNFLMDKIGFLYWSAFREILEQILEKIKNIEKHRASYDYLNDVNSKILKRYKLYHL